MPESRKKTVREFVMTPKSVTIGSQEGQEAAVNNKNSNLISAPLTNNIDFEIKGHLDTTNIHMEEALTGESKNIVQCFSFVYKIIQGILQ